MNRTYSSENIRTQDPIFTERRRSKTFSEFTSHNRKSPTRPKRRVYKVAVLGEKSVGKTAIVVRLLTGKFIYDYASGQEASYQHRYEDGNDDIVFEIVDTSGEAESSCVSSSDAVIIVFSVDNLVSFKNVRSLIANVRTRNHKDPDILVLGNKSDLWHYRAVQTFEGERFAKQNGCTYVEVSALQEAAGINRAFSLLFKRLQGKDGPRHSPEIVYCSSEEANSDDREAHGVKMKKSRSPVIVRKLLKSWYSPSRKRKEGPDHTRLSMMSL